MITDLIMGVSHFCKLLQGSRRFFRWKKRKGAAIDRSDSEDSQESYS